jgi:hypothetical protein
VIVELAMRHSLPRLTLLVAALVAAGCASPPRIEAPTLLPSSEVRIGAPTADGQYLIGKRKLADGDADGALLAFDHALRLDARHLDARNGRATALARTGRVDAAIATLRAALVDAPGAAHLHNNLGYLLMTQGRLEEASAALREATAAEPGNPRYRANLDALGRRAPAHAGAGASVTQAPGAPEAVVARRPSAPAPAELTGPVLTLSWPVADATARKGAVAAPAARTAAAGAPAAVDAAGGPADAVRTVSSATALPRLEISNGGGITGAARRTAATLREAGVPVARVTNHSDYRQASTSIHYRDGQRDAALRLQARLGLPETALVRSDRLAPGVDAKLLLGRDTMRAGLGADRKLHADALDALREQAAALSALLDASVV